MRNNCVNQTKYPLHNHLSVAKPCVENNCCNFLQGVGCYLALSLTYGQHQPLINNLLTTNSNPKNVPHLSDLAIFK